MKTIYIIRIRKGISPLITKLITNRHLVEIRNELRQEVENWEIFEWYIYWEDEIQKETLIWSDNVG